VFGVEFKTTCCALRVDVFKKFVEEIFRLFPGVFLDEAGGFG